MPHHAPLARAASSSPAAVLVAALLALLLVAPAHAAANNNKNNNNKNAKTTTSAIPASVMKSIAAAASSPGSSPSLQGALLDQEVLLASSYHEGEKNRLRQVVAGGSLAAGQGTPARRFYSPVVMCVTSGCVKAVAKDGGRELANKCAGAGGQPACASLGGSTAFSLVAANGAAARYIEFTTVWPGNQLYTSA